jgi:methionyl-tRNA formyltransferase
MKLFLVGHDNTGSRAIFKSIRTAFPEAEIELAITTGLYYRKTFVQSLAKLLRESSFIFCASRALEMISHRLRGETLRRIARESDVPFFETDDINEKGTVARIKAFEPDFLVSLYTMHIYRAEVLAIPRLAAVSAHPSIIPNYRGLEVFFWAMANGEDSIGVSAFKLTPKIDFGLIVNEVILPLYKPDRMQRVYAAITDAAATLLVKSIREILEGKAEFRAPSGAEHYFKMPTREAMARFWRAGHSLF